MLESYLLEGSQPFPRNPRELCYGVSITDACLGWEATERMVRWANEKLAEQRFGVPGLHGKGTEVSKADS